FDTNGIPPTVIINRVTGSGPDAWNINGAADGAVLPLTSVSSTQMTFTVTDTTTNGVTCSITVQDMRVRPTAGTPLAFGFVTKGGDGNLVGVTNNDTPIGVLIEVAGVAKQFAILSQPSSTVQAGTIFPQQPSLAILDQFGNQLTTDNGHPDDATIVTAGLASGAGTVMGTVTAQAA